MKTFSHQTTSRWKAAAFLCGCAMALLFALAPLPAHALEEPEYTPGEDYYVDEPDAFLEQDPGYDDAQDGSGKTEYWLTCPFYLDWTAPDMVVKVGDDGYIGCGAIGLEDVTYQWFVSADGGKTWSDLNIREATATIPDMRLNSPAEQPYLYKCLITNGDGLSTLEAFVTIRVVSDGSGIIPGDKGHFGSFVKTGDDALVGVTILVLLAFTAFALTVLALAKRKKDGDDDRP